MSNKTKADIEAESQGCYFDQEQADRVIRFASKYVSPQFINGKFKLLDWQEDWLRNLYGWRLASGARRWRRAFLTMAKKNGKSLISSIVCAYELYASQTPSPLVVSASTSIANARQIFDQIKHTVNNSAKLKNISKIVASQKILRVPKLDGEFRCISTDAGNAEGLNLSCCICDECHAWQNSNLWRTLEYSTIARPDGLLIVISTAGRNKDHFFYDLYCKAKRVLSGEDTDITFFPTIYETPEVSTDLTDPKLWLMSNPSLGTSFQIEDMQRDLEAASKSTSDLLSARRYRLNQWAGAEDSWIDLSKWDECRGQLTGLEQYPCVVSADLSQTVDPSSVSAVFSLPGKKYAIQSWAWVAEKGVKRRETGNLPLYQQFANDGYMIITPGETIDERAIKAFILDLTKKYRVKHVVFDPTSAYVMASNLESEGIDCLRQPQTHKYYSPAIKAFEQAVLEKRIVHDGNSWLRYCINNMRLDENSQAEVRPSKKKSADHIDGAVSVLMSFGLGVVNEQANKPMKNPFRVL